MKATAKAHPNIALVKYWGKRDERLILPHQSSLSVTLGPLSVTTTVEFEAARGDDEVSINGKVAQGGERQRVVALLQLVRREAKVRGVRGLGRARMTSAGDFPAAAGLASSAAAFAALAVAARAAAGLKRDVKAESVLARQGSGSACRSVEGGFVRWNKGSRADGRDSFGEQLFEALHWPELRLLVGMVSREEKEVKSRDGMRGTVKTSPYYPAWARDADLEVKRIVPFIKRRDLEAVGEIAERNAWRMHATAFAANPPLCYLKPETLSVIQACAQLRKQGVGVWFTLDAGPNPVLLTSAKDEAAVAKVLTAHGASEIVRCHPGGDAQLTG
ncbi:MAG: diphosphomevalonate decarboxylase [Myxococcaceae bacterium]|nr:diphosphomevalonate decarboxylase [Myxococcaceae bacterium]